MSLPTRVLGKNGPQVTGVGLGLMGISAMYGPKLSDDKRLAFLDAAYDMGERNWDTADMYGDSEELVGTWLKKNPGKREHIFIATKFANRLFPDGSRKIDSSPEYARQALDTSLSRLGLPSVDLYYVHRLDGVTPIEKTVETLAEFQKAGKIKHIGLSECSASSLRRAYAVAPITAVQIEYSPFTLDIEDPKVQLLATARELGVATVAYSPLGRGMLTGAIKSRADFEEGDWRLNAPRFSEENFPKNLELVNKLSAIAKKKNVAASTLTLAWILNQGGDIVPIPGTTKIDRLKENVQALSVKLTPEEDKEIRDACKNAVVSGPRYPEAMAATLFRDTPPLKA